MIDTIQPIPSAQSIDDLHATTSPVAVVLLPPKDATGSPGRSEAFLNLTQLRTVGLLADLPSEEFQSLVTVLSFATKPDLCLPSVEQLAHALHLPVHKAERRLQRAARFRWHKQPVLKRIERPFQTISYTPADRVVTIKSVGNTAPSAPITYARREDIIAASRRQFTRPREVVERTIAAQMGWDQSASTRPELPEQRHIMSELRKLGVDEPTVASLVQRFVLADIRRQIDRLPQRDARNPVAFLIAAIEGNYGPPSPPPIDKVRSIGPVQGNDASH